MLTVAVLASACSGGVGGQAIPQSIAPSPAPTAPTAPLPSVLPVVSPSSESSASAGMQAAVDAAMREAARRVGVASGSGDIHAQQVEARQWPDSSLGCPSQDVMYSQVVTPGYVVVIGAAGKQLEYHADSRGTVVFCQEL